MSGEPQGPLLTLGGDLESAQGMEVKGQDREREPPCPFLETLSRTSGSEILERAAMTSLSQACPRTPPHTHTHRLTPHCFAATWELGGRDVEVGEQLGGWTRQPPVALLVARIGVRAGPGGRWAHQVVCVGEIIGPAS